MHISVHINLLFSSSKEVDKEGVNRRKMTLCCHMHETGIVDHKNHKRISFKAILIPVLKILIIIPF